MQLSTIVNGIPYGPYRITASDSASSISRDYLESFGSRAIGAFITVETNNLRVAFNTNPTTTVGHLVEAGQSLRLSGSAAVSAFRYINATAGSNCVFQLTLEF